MTLTPQQSGAQIAGTLDSAVRWWASEKPDRFFIETETDAVTYAEMNAWVGRVAAKLADMGVDTGDRVCICAHNSIEWCVAELAAVRAGAIMAGLAVGSPSSEIDYLVELYEPTVIVLDSDTAANMRENRRVKRLSMADIRQLRTGGSMDLWRDLDPDAPVLIITTSGSTSRPKGVVFSHRRIFENCTWRAISFPLNASYRRQLISSPLSVSGGGQPFIHTLLLGGTAVLERKFEAAVSLRLLVEKEINFYAAVPLFFERMAREPAFANADLSHIKLATTGGAPVPVDVLHRWAEKDVLVRQMYGQTESGGTVCMNSEANALSYPDRCGSSGMFMQIAIIDSTGKRLSNGKSGEIIVKGPGAMLGYWRNPEATQDVLIDGWVHTGDVGMFDELGLLKMVDRLKDIIISGGLNIAAAEVEAAIQQFPGVEEVAVVAAPDAEFGETPCAIVYSKVDVVIPALIEHCRVQLARYKLPRYFVIQNEPLPRLAAGKIAKAQLRTHYADPKHLPSPAR